MSGKKNEKKNNNIFILSFIAIAAIALTMYFTSGSDNKVKTGKLNVYDMSFTETFEKLKKQIKIGGEVRLDRNDLTYDSEGNITYLRFYLESSDNGEHHVYNVWYSPVEKHFSVTKIEIDKESLSFDSLIDANSIFKALDTLKFEELGPEAEAGSKGETGVIFLGYNNYDTKEDLNFKVENGEIVTLSNEELPYEGYGVVFYSKENDLQNHYYFIDLD